MIFDGKFLSEYEYMICMFSFIINIFHLIVLTRKYMRTASIYILLIGICISEIFTMILPVKNKIEYLIASSNKCQLPASILQIYLDRIFTATTDNFTRLSTLLCIFFGLVRVLVLRNMTDNRFQMLSAPGFGWILTFISFVMSFIASLSYYFKYQITENGPWIPKIGCETVTVSESLIQYHLTTSDLYTFGNGIFEILLFIANGSFSHILPCILFPVIIVFLTMEVIKSKNVSNGTARNPHQKRNKQTTILVNIISIFQFLLQISYATIFVAEIIFGRESLDFINYGHIAIRWFFAFNSSTRCFLCVLFSCRYRNAIRRMFRLTDRMAINQTSSLGRPSPSLQRSASTILPPCSPKMESSL